MIRNLLDHPINLLIVVLVIVVVVGWKRLPDVARSLGRSVRILKSEVDEMKQDGKSTPSAASSDTVKGDTVKDEAAESPINDPTRRSASDQSEREKHNQTPA
ncbi:MAG: sec-independent protein translocase protein TatA [Actinomycetota bacterium]|jgi:sec-independent protein translocase protein TatA|nr:sec-independent protein translocase protein TatA [Actinomycetota bacterium]